MRKNAALEITSFESATQNFPITLNKRALKLAGNTFIRPLNNTKNVIGLLEKTTELNEKYLIGLV